MNFLMEHKMTFKEFTKQYPEYCYNPKKPKNSYMKFLCQCKFGHIFDYRVRKIQYGDIYYAPCQGKCPICGITKFYFMKQNYIK